ncbi:protein sym-1-like isoform X3 [Durio zibethinus]|uniref:Protein sym-1-like isoform X3 n=1 Tax=Durio zibethinus TaxID=66656 RepID=A0A6P6B6U6_DURZI|nr:protein sym-1-like isoform X3 [Durio zibethinus]
MVSSGNTLKGLSKLCLRLSSDSHLLLHGKSFTDASLTNLRWRFYSLSSPHKLPSFKGSPPSRSFSSSSSSSEVGFLGWYLGKLGSNPLITKAITTSIIFAAADFTSQMITSASSGYDLAIFGPVSTTVFFSYNAALQGESGEEIVARLKRDLLPTLINGAMFWPICDFVTYKFVPVHLQPLMNSSCAYMWTIYLTYMASLKKASID